MFVQGYNAEFGSICAYNSHINIGPSSFIIPSSIFEPQFASAIAKYASNPAHLDGTQYNSNGSVFSN